MVSIILMLDLFGFVRLWEEVFVVEMARAAAMLCVVGLLFFAELYIQRGRGGM